MSDTQLAHAPAEARQAQEPKVYAAGDIRAGVSQSSHLSVVCILLSCLTEAPNHRGCSGNDQVQHEISTPILQVIQQTSIEGDQIKDPGLSDKASPAGTSHSSAIPHICPL